jgi:hypothetical protein
MALKPSIPGGANYEVGFRSSGQSTGTTLLTVGWVPNQQNPVPPAQDTSIAPGMTGRLNGTVPSATNARRIEIRLDLPDGRGWGTLTLKINGAIHAEDQLAEDTTWTCIVV